jgi:uncharacterized protein YciI
MIKTRDKPDSLDRRNALRPLHIAYLDSQAHLILAAGALLEDDGSGGHGGLILVDIETRAEAEAFINNDPFAQGGLFESIEIARWRKAFFNHQRME